MRNAAQTFEEKFAKDPSLVIQRLLVPDMKLWQGVRDSVIVPYLKKSRYGEMAKSKNIEDDEVYGYVYTMMVTDGKLNKIRNKSQLTRYIEQYVRKYVQLFYRVQKKKIDLGPIGEEEWAAWERNHVQDFIREEKRLQQKDLISAAMRHLWKENPKQAYILALKTKNMLSSREVKNLCGISTEQNVNKIFERGKNTMRGKLAGGL